MEEKKTMTASERELLPELVKAFLNLSEAKQEYVLGVAHGMAMAAGK